MPLYIGDYLGDTRHLNQGQHGAYLLLIMHYWQRGSIPSEPESCYCIACAMDEQSRRNADAVLKQFFVLEGDSYRHLRVEEELQKSKTSHEARLRAANSRWSKHSKSNAGAFDIRKPLTPSDCDSGVDLDLLSREAKVTEESFSLDATVSYVMCETGLAGKNIRSVLYEVIKREIDVVGIEPKLIANTLVVAWGTYDPMKLKFKRSPENFFGSGMWRKPASEWAESGKEETLAEKNTNALREMERRTKQN